MVNNDPELWRTINKIMLKTEFHEAILSNYGKSCPSLNLCGNKRLNSLGSKLYKSIAINPLLQVLFLTPGSFLAKPNPLSFSGGK